jgi:hypothetical protein
MATRYGSTFVIPVWLRRGIPDVTTSPLPPSTSHQLTLVFTSPTKAREPSMYLVTFADKMRAELALVAIGKRI